MNVLVRFSPPSVTRILVIVATVLLVASMLGNLWVRYGNGDEFWIVTRIFDFDVKNNLPHAYKAILLFSCSVALFCVAHERRLSGAPRQRHWRVMAWIFLYLAIDQEIQIHQQFAAPLIARLKGEEPETAPDAKVYWLVPYLLFASGFAVAYFRFWWELPPRIRMLFASAGVVYISGVAVLEKLAHNYLKTHPDPNFVYMTITNVSEWLQMIGSIIFLRAQMEFLKLRDAHIHLECSGKGTQRDG